MLSSIISCLNKTILIFKNNFQNFRPAKLECHNKARVWSVPWRRRALCHVRRRFLAWPLWWSASIRQLTLPHWQSQSHSSAQHHIGAHSRAEGLAKCLLGPAKNRIASSFSLVLRIKFLVSYICACCFQHLSPVAQHLYHLMSVHHASESQKPINFNKLKLLSPQFSFLFPNLVDIHWDGQYRHRNNNRGKIGIIVHVPYGDTIGKRK